MKIFFTIVALLFSVTPAWAASSLPNFSARVEVSISSTNDISAKVESFINRELRSLGDVVITNENPKWILNIVAMTIETQGGQKRGVAFSVVIFRPFDNSSMEFAVKPAFKKVITMYTDNLYGVPEHWLQVGSTDDLRSICNSIVARFDTEELAPKRKEWATLNKYLNSDN